MSSAARLDANTAGVNSRAMRSSVAVVPATSVSSLLMDCSSDAGADVFVFARCRGRAQVAAEQRLALVDRSLVGFGEHRQALQRVLDAAVRTRRVGVEADPFHLE